MAEIQSSKSSRKKGGYYRGKKLSTRIDLTPMVDLGFLLITFFIVTTTLAQPTAMKLVMPDDAPTKTPMLTSSEKTITLLLAKDDFLYYYSGVFAGVTKKIYLSELRGVIMDKKHQVSKLFGSNKITVLIKATNEAKFKNIVNSLDEMVINDVSTYMLIEPETRELEAIK